MNQSIIKNLDKFNVKGNNILNYQLGTIDYIVKNCTSDDPKNILLYHYMGTGKTHTSLFSAFILSTLKKKIYIIATNETTINIFSDIIEKIFLWTYYVENREKINLITSKEFINIIKKDKDSIINMFEDSIIFIDEAHQSFGNTYGESIIELNNIIIKENKKYPIIILLSGSPIINTFKTLRFLLSILLRININESDFIKERGKITELQITNDGLEYLNQLKGQVSYYIQKSDSIPKIFFNGDVLLNIPTIKCIMSDEQKKYYYDVIDSLTDNEINSDMFLKKLLLPSFSTINNIKIEDFDNLSMKFTEHLFLKNGEFYGDELINLNNSCKLKFFFETFIWNYKAGKVFIYFTAATIGGKFLRDTLYQQGIKEYGSTDLTNFVCVICRKKKTCNICIPMTYIMLTSKYETKLDDRNNLIELLDIFNKPNNNDGQMINLIFGSKKLSESYTLKEVKHIVYLSVPETIGELVQSLGRVSRVFSHNDVLNVTINIFILIAITGDSEVDNMFKKNKINKFNYIFDIENYKNEDNNNNQKIYEKYIMINNKEISFDLRKLIYLELKSENNINILNKLKNCHIDYESTINEHVKKLYSIELIKRISYNNNIFEFDDIKHNSDNILSSDELKIIFDEFVNDQLIVNNKIFNMCILQKFINDKYITYPIFLKYPRHINVIPLSICKNIL